MSISWLIEFRFRLCFWSQIRFWSEKLGRMLLNCMCQDTLQLKDQQYSYVCFTGHETKSTKFNTQVP